MRYRVRLSDGSTKDLETAIAFDLDAIGVRLKEPRAGVESDAAYRERLLDIVCPFCGGIRGHTLACQAITAECEDVVAGRSRL